MNWIDSIFDASISLPLSLFVLAVIGLLSWRKVGRQAILTLTLLLYARYLWWRGLYTLNTENWITTLASWAVYTAEIFAFVQIVLFAYHAWSTIERRPIPLRGYPSVDIFVTVVNEPLSILHRTLIGCLNQNYPRDRYRVHVLDDGHRDDIKALANSLKCGYITRADRRHAKAGNLNHALQETSGEIVAIFDVDHVPTSGFLADTVGFFQDERVAFVQTPHHFYNPDVFQKNLRAEDVVMNEQALFYHVLQSGRDRHNSAFFAGSCGLFRRRVLSEIGGFRTETVTEDIHTSMMVHAKGYRSCYFNTVLAAGLSPETFESAIKQRIRWATGHLQILFQTNPLTMRGLTLPQRIGYFASIFYFCHGIPRLICLVAPLLALLCGVIPVMADVPSLVHFYGTYYLATLVMLRTVSRGTRNAFWSDIYETADCFALTWATLKTALRPRKRRPFIITQKGVSQENRGFSRFSYSVPHLVTMGLLIAGIASGIRSWFEQVPVPGLAISLFWAGVNLVLVSVTVLEAAELPNWRKGFRIKRRLPCELLTEDTRLRGVVEDLSETGARIHAAEQVLVSAQPLRVRIDGEAGEGLTLAATICRQERVSSNSVEIGLEFVDVREHHVRALILKSFSDPSVWNRPMIEPGVVRSLWAVLRVFRIVFIPSRTSHRLHLRRAYRQDCRLTFQDRILDGTLDMISPRGVSVNIPGTIDLLGEEGMLEIGACTLKIHRTWAIQCDDIVRAGFTIERVEKGANQWRELTAHAA